MGCYIKPALYRCTQDWYAQLSRQEHRESVRRFYAFCSYEDYLFGMLESTGRGRTACSCI